jgi:peptidoglycan L-alanyl-D-glutamate endopeptidase CwlK
MAYRFSARSETNLRGVHKDLVAVTRRALELTEVDFTVIEGLRSAARQRQLVAKGASKTMNSRHLTGHAIDIAPYIDGSIRWDWPPFYQLSDAMKKAAAERHVPLEWGGDWQSFKDGPHFQLPWAVYPA